MYFPYCSYSERPVMNSLSDSAVVEDNKRPTRGRKTAKDEPPVKKATARRNTRNSSAHGWYIHQLCVG